MYLVNVGIVIININISKYNIVITQKTIVRINECGIVIILIIFITLINLNHTT